MRLRLRHCVLLLLATAGLWSTGCVSTKLGDTVDTVQQRKEPVDESYRVSVADASAADPGRVTLEVERRPEFQVRYVRQRAELSKRSSAPGGVMTTAGIVGLVVSGSMLPECATEDYQECSSSEKTKRENAYKVLVPSLAVGTLGLLSMWWAGQKDEYTPTGDRVAGESFVRTEEGEAGPAANQSLRLRLNGTTREYTTNDRGTVTLDVADDFNLRSVEDPDPLVATVLLPDRDYTQSLTLNPKEWTVPYFRLAEAQYRLRDRPSQRGTIQGVTQERDLGEEYRIQARRNGWVKLEYRGRTHWVHGDAGTVFWAVPTRLDSDRLPRVAASATFTEPSGNNRLDADETARVRVTAENEGEGPAYRVRAYVEPETRAHLSYPQVVEFGRIDAGESTTKTLRVEADRELSSGEAALTFRFREANGFAPSPLRVQFETRRFIPPELTVADVGIDDANGNGMIDRGEVVNVTARIRNASSGRAQDVSAQVHFGENVFPASNTQQSFDLGNLGAGEHQDIRFRFYTNQQARAVPVTVDLTEKYGEFGKTGVELPLKFNQPTDEVTVVDVPGQDETVTVEEGLSVDVETNIPSTPMDRPNAVAVVIGNRTYRNRDVPNVEYARRDARIVKKYLTQTLGFREDNIIYVKNATAAALTRIFGTADDPQGQLHNWVTPGKSDVFVYYSGHGAPNPESGTAYLLPTDTNPNYLSQNGYPVEQLYENLATVPARSVTVALEACFSGVSEGGAVIQRASPVKLSVESPLLTMENGLAFTAGAADQIASWYPEKKHGLFTYYFLKGLKGSANQNGDRTLTAREMETYLTETIPPRARRRYNREQTPQVVGTNPDRVLVRYETPTPGGK